MSNAVLQSRRERDQLLPELRLIKGGAGLDVAPSHPDLVFVGLLLVVLQILDGVLTAAGVNVYGIHAEGNPLLRSLMHLIGFLPAIIITKTVCVGFTVYLCSQAKSIHWLPLALRCVAVLYTVMAVVPWTVILAAEYLG